MCHQYLDFTIITPSNWLAKRVKRSFLKDKIIKVINNGIDTQVFKPVIDKAIIEDLQIPMNSKIVLAVAPGIMSESKGGKWVLELADCMNEQKLNFVLIGQ